MRSQSPEDCQGLAFHLNADQGAAGLGAQPQYLQGEVRA